MRLVSLYPQLAVPRPCADAELGRLSRSSTTLDDWPSAFVTLAERPYESYPNCVVAPFLVTPARFWKAPGW